MLFDLYFGDIPQGNDMYGVQYRTIIDILYIRVLLLVNRFGG